MRIRLDEVTKRFGAVTAVDSLDLDVRDGEFLALLGPSGCGKSTTLMMLAGIQQPTAGDIRFDDRVVNAVPPRERGIGMVFQSYALYPHMTVRANIEFPLLLQQAPAGERRERARAMAALLQIEGLLDRQPEDLSGGQQQRVALARALVKRPGLLLLDEPLANLDARLRLEMREEIKRVQVELGVTTVLVTHDQEEATAMADRVALLRAGRIQQIDTPWAIYHQPCNRFVAGFIGTPPMNLLEVVVEGTPGGSLLTAPGVSLSVGRALPKGPAVLGVRPHDLALTTVADGALRGEVYVTEHLGRDTLVGVRVGTLVVRAFGPDDLRLPLGTGVGLRLVQERFHLFSTDQEGRVLAGSAAPVVA